MASKLKIKVDGLRLDGLLNGRAHSSATTLDRFVSTNAG